MRAAAIILGVAVLVSACATDPGDAAKAGAGFVEPTLPPPVCDDVCETCGDACDPDGTGLECTRQRCDVTGSCLCYLDTALDDCPDTGCCGVQYDTDGEPIVDAGGAPIYGCVVPVCTTDDDCADGEVCVIGLTCDQSFCTCDIDLDGDGFPDDDDGDDFDDEDDGELECCEVENDDGACCESGEVDADTGLCVCAEGSLLVDDGDGCACPTGMTPDDDGNCVCYDPDAAYDPETGECHCSDPSTEEVDGDGVVTCTSDEDCGDPYAYYDTEADVCECVEGYHLGEHDDYVTPRCVPDDEPDVDAAPWDADADPIDADADTDTDADADAPWDADASPLDADAAPAPHDAQPIPHDAYPCTTTPAGFVICHTEEGPLP